MICEACGEPGAEPAEVFDPWKGRDVQALMCRACARYWSSEIGQAAMLADAVEVAERRAGWDPNP